MEKMKTDRNQTIGDLYTKQKRKDHRNAWITDCNLAMVEEEKINGYRMNTRIIGHNAKYM